MRLFAAPILLGLAGPLVAQARPELTAMATMAWHRASTTPEGGALGEVKLVRPVIMTHWAPSPAIAFRGTLNLEGVTMPAGELLPGGWGEGFVDRRHPHTVVHELVAEARQPLGCGRPGRCEIGGFVGKGFVPFGSPDPMTRGFLGFPVNHHLAQILERATAAAQVRVGPGTAEFALFNGDEPERPGQWPRIAGRFGDSWALRLALRPAAGILATGSWARVASPEHRPGAGARQRKRHLSLGFEPSEHPVRVLLEWAETSELGRTFVFASRLAETEYRLGRVTVRYRYEDTDRPEEERLSPFRSARPHLENAILGTTRWRTHTAGATVRLRSIGRLATEFIVEGSRATVTRRGVGIFEPATVYGTNPITVGSVAIQFAWGRSRHGMGSYGIQVARLPHHEPKP